MSCAITNHHLQRYILIEQALDIYVDDVVCDLLVQSDLLWDKAIIDAFTGPMEYLIGPYKTKEGEAPREKIYQTTEDIRTLLAFMAPTIWPITIDAEVITWLMLFPLFL